MNRSLPLTLGTLAASLAVAVPALAVDRFADPNGGDADTCALVDHCSLAAAAASALAGDHIKLLPGVHTVVFTVPLQVANLTVEPAEPGTRPTITSAMDQDPVISVLTPGNEKTVIKDVDVTNTSNAVNQAHSPIDAGSALQLSNVTLSSTGKVLAISSQASGSLIEDVTVTQTQAAIEHPVTLEGPGSTIRRLSVASAATGVGAEITGDGTQVTDSSFTGGYRGLQLMYGAAARRVTATAAEVGIWAVHVNAVTDSVAVVTGPDAGAAIKVEDGAPTLRNVTAFGSAAGSVGLLSVGAMTVADARNVIAKGALHDVEVTDGGKLTLDHSLFSTLEGALAGGTANLNAAPAFVNAAAGDLHLVGGSAGVDAGVADGLLGAADRDGKPRQQGSAVDIGAFEQEPVVIPPAPEDEDIPQNDPPVVDPVVPVTPTTPTTPTVSTVGTPIVTPADTAAPKFTAVKTTAKRGQSAKINLTLNEASTLQVVLQKQQNGKRQGSKCVKATAKLRKAKSCTLQKTILTSRKTLQAGTTKISVGSKLTRGTYSVIITAEDVAGNRVKTTKTFKIT